MSPQILITRRVHPGMTLQEAVMTGALADHEVEIVHYDDGDGPYATVVDLAPGRIADEGMAEWADVLSAPIQAISDWYGTPMIHLEMEDTEAAMDRVRAFVEAYGGSCSEAQWYLWFCDDPEGAVE